jgi:hypothetical protein
MSPPVFVHLTSVIRFKSSRHAAEGRHPVGCRIFLDFELGRNNGWRLTDINRHIQDSVSANGSQQINPCFYRTSVLVQQVFF